MKTATETIWNFTGNKKDLAEEVKKSILFWKLLIQTQEMDFKVNLKKETCQKGV